MQENVCKIVHEVSTGKGGKRWQSKRIQWIGGLRGTKELLSELDSWREQDRIGDDGQKALQVKLRL